MRTAFKLFLKVAHYSTLKEKVSTLRMKEHSVFKGMLSQSRRVHLKYILMG